MKRTVYLLLIISLMLTLVSCGGPQSYSALNTLASKNYGMINMTISTVNDGVKLDSEFSVMQNIVSYSVEVLNELTLDGTEEQISKKNGKAVVVNGSIVSFNGEQVELPSYSMLSGKLSFDEDNFKDASFGDGSFSASIISLSKFLKCEVDGEFGRVSVEYDSSAIKTLELRYISNGAIVNISYTYI